MDYLVLLYAGAFVFLGSLILGVIFDGTLRRKPSDWVGYSYLATLVMGLGYGSKYLDETRSHPYLAAMIGVVAVAIVAWLTIILWRKAAKWDKNFENRHTRT